MPLFEEPFAQVGAEKSRASADQNSLTRHQAFIPATGPFRKTGPKRPVLAPPFARDTILTMSDVAEERRGGPRIPLEMWVEETTGSERYFRRAGNLSRGGLRLEHTIPLPVGTSVNLTFTLPGDKTPIEVTGEMVSAAAPEDLRMGVKFTNLSAEARDKIDAFLARAGA